MNWLSPTLILLAAILAVYWQAAFPVLRSVLGAQPDLLPGLMVYAALGSRIQTIVLLSFVGGLGQDALSANPLGISVLPLFAFGLAIYAKRDLIVKDQLFAQSVLGLAVSFLNPILCLLLLLSLGKHPLLGWGTLWQIAIMTIVGGMVTPIWFELFRWLEGTLGPSRATESSFRPDREIRRGRA